MSSSNAIGSASVVLTANADGLAAGLDKAERKVSGFAGDVGKKLDRAAGGGAGGGGFLGKLLGGTALAGAAGAVAGAVAGGVMKGFQLLGELPDLIRGLAEGATGGDAGPLRGLVAGIDKFMEKGRGLLSGFFAAIAPGATAIGDVIVHAMERAEPVIRGVGSALSWAFEFAAPFIEKAAEAVGMLAQHVGNWLSPVVEKLGRAFDVVGSVFGAVLDDGLVLFGEMLDGIGRGIEAVTSWVSEFFSLETAVTTVEGVVFGFLRGFSKGAAYVWDSLRAGVGAMSYVASYIVDGFALIVDAFKDTINDLLNIAGRLPDSLGGAGFRRLAEQAEGWGAGIAGAAERMREWGASAITTWGDTARGVDAFFDRLEGRFSRRTARAMEVAAQQATAPKLAGALERGSKEAYSVATNFQVGADSRATDPTRQQTRLTEETNRLLREVVRSIAGAAVLRTV